jgi:quercetin dioxygenase-like cupin family protein
VFIGEKGEHRVIEREQRLIVNTREDGVIWFLGLPTALRATGETTNGAFGLIEHWTMPPGFASPYHMHHLEDEAFYVLEGRVAFVCDGKWFRAEAGAYVFGPREIPHGFRIEGATPARMLLLCAPAGFEQFVLEMSEPAPNLRLPPPAPDMAKLMGLAQKYRIDILGPLPEETGIPA